MQLCVSLAVVFLVLYRIVYVATTLLSVTADGAACISATAGAGS
jgi:hypothetical protein